MKDSKIRVLDHSWHLAHQFDLCNALKENCKFSWIMQHRRDYSSFARGDFVKDFDIEIVDHFEREKFDVAILHLDQQCVEETLWDRGKGSLYKELNETIKGVPKIVIIHGTPYYPEMFGDFELCRRFKSAVGKNFVVVNSHTARLQWAYGISNTINIIAECKKKGINWTGLTSKEVSALGMFDEIGIPLDQIKTIVHGMDPAMYKNLPKDPRVVTMISPGGLDKYYDRHFLQVIRDGLIERQIAHCHITVDVRFNNFEEYTNFLGRSLVYLNPTRESPMPRARTEAMLSGCCVVTTPGQDADLFIQNGVNGFLIPRNPDKVCDLVEGLILEYRMAKKIGQAGRETALKMFTYERYRKDWMDLLNKVLSNK